MKFYTDAISKELLDALISKGYPYKNIPMDYRTLYDEDGVIVGGFPEYGIEVPTYAEVLDWMITKGIDISIGHVRDTENWFALTDKPGTFTNHNPLKETLEKVILLGLDFIEFPDNSGSSYSTSIE